LEHEIIQPGLSSVNKPSKLKRKVGYGTSGIQGETSKRKKDDVDKDASMGENDGIQSLV